MNRDAVEAELLYGPAQIFAPSSLPPTGTRYRVKSRDQGNAGVLEMPLENKTAFQLQQMIRNDGGFTAVLVGTVSAVNRAEADIESSCRQLRLNCRLKFK